MGTRTGLVVGAGSFTLDILDEAKRGGRDLVVAGIRGEADPGLETKAAVFAWFEPGEIKKLAAFFREREIHEIFMLGKVDPRSIWTKPGFDEIAEELLARAQERTPSSLLKQLFAFLETQGVAVKDPSSLLQPYLFSEGVLGKVQPSSGVLEDMNFGWMIARALADLEVGQTAIVKDRMVVAVEGMEGTDETIRRGGRLAGNGIIVVKVGRSDQDMRIDVPAVGLETLRNLVKAKGTALCIEAGRVPLFQKDDVITLADANGIAVVARKS